jgi:hypothetical protein
MNAVLRFAAFTDWASDQNAESTCEGGNPCAVGIEMALVGSSGDRSKPVPMVDSLCLLHGFGLVDVRIASERPHRSPTKELMALG